MTDPYTRTRIHRACVSGDLEILQQLVKSGVDILSFNVKPLISTCIKGHLNIIKYLVSIGIDVKSDGDLAVGLAITYKEFGVAKYLISLGANPFSKNNDLFKRMIRFKHTTSAKYMTDLPLHEMKMNTLLSLLNKRVIHRNLINYVRSIKYVEHYKYFQQVVKHGPEEDGFDRSMLKLESFLS